MRTATVLMLALCGCEQPVMTTPTLVCPGPAPEVTYSFGPPIRTALLGRPTTQLLEIPCRSDGVVTGVRLFLEDESREPQPFTATPLELVDSSFRTTFEFVPNTPGGWRLTASLDPDRAGSGAWVLVALDRTQASPIATLTIPNPESCSRLEWADGLLGCVNSTSLSVFLDGGLLDQQPLTPGRDGKVFATGKVLWSWTRTRTTRWQGANRLDVSTNFTSRPSLVTADTTRIQFSDHTGLWEIAVAPSSDGGTNLEQRLLLNDAGISPEHVLAVDGGWVWPSRDEFCFRGPNPPTQCARWTGFGSRVIGVEGDGYWFAGVRTSFVRFGAGPTPISERAHELLFDISDSTPLQIVDRTPWAREFPLSLTVNRESLKIEQWPNFERHSASTRHFFGISGTQVSVFER